MSEQEMRKMCKLIVKWLNMKNTKWMRPYLFTLKKCPGCCWDGVSGHMYDLKDAYEAHIKRKFVSVHDYSKYTLHISGEGYSTSEALEDLVEDIWLKFQDLKSDSYEELKLKLIARGEMPEDE